MTTSQKISELVKFVDDALRPVVRIPEEVMAERHWILDYYFHISKEMILSHPEKEIQLGSRYEEMVECIKKRVEERVPIQYLLGEVWFYGKKFKVTPDVLIPYADTEILVEQVLQATTPHPNPLPKGEGIKVVDLGTGSGCIAITIKDNRPDWDVTAVDISEKALVVARQNAELHQASVRFLHGSWFEPLGIEKFDFITCNPPYVSTQKGLSPEVLHEPFLALFPEGNPDDLYQFLFEQAKPHLNPKGVAFFEMEVDQAPRLIPIAAQLGYQARIIKDYNGVERVIALTSAPY